MKLKRTRELKNGDLVKTPDGYFGIVTLTNSTKDTVCIFLGNGTQLLANPIEVELVLLPTSEAPQTFHELLNERNR